MSEMKNSTLEPSITLDVKCGAVRDDCVKALGIKSSYWLDAAERRNKMRAGFELLPMGGLVVDFPVEGVKEGEALTVDQLSEYLTRGLSTLFGPVNVFVEESTSDF